MRILAIRGKNLASLAGEFCIDMEDGPLASSGLFAITGPTGSGKTTLLDALCVALYDKTPRLDSRANGVLIGRAETDDVLRMQANDVRSLLRRGTATGFAEVDFVGRDGTRYQSRWEVRRARNRIDGRLQKQTMSLRDLDTGRDLSGTGKKETLGVIEERLGLSFEQFRRSTLLAQGEFAAFLRASSQQRSGLLERMTGTQIYTEISQQAFLRAKHERQALAALTSSVDEHAVLDDEARAVLEAEVVAAKARVKKLQTQLAAVEAVLAWYADLEKLRAAEGEAKEQLDVAQKHWASSAEWRAELAGVTVARGMRAETNAFDLASAELSRSSAEIVRLTEAQTALSARGSKAAALLASAAEVLAVARSEFKEAQPRLSEATRIDGELMAARRAVESAVAVADKCEQRLAAVIVAGKAMAAKLAQLVEEGAVASSWLAAHADVEGLASEWKRWRAVLDRYAKVAAERDAADARRDDLVEADDACRELQVAAEKGRDAAKLAFTESQELADRAEKAADEQPVDAVRKKMRLVEARHALLVDLVQAAEGAADSGARLAEATRDGDGARLAEAEATKKLAELERWHLRVDAQCGEAERSLNQIKLAQDMSDHRADLVDGEPCPLCGADEHPFAAGGRVNELAAEQQQHLDDLQGERRDVNDKRIAEASRIDAAQDATARAVELAETCQGRLTTSGAAWAAALKQLGELPLFSDPADAKAGEWARGERDACHEDLKQLRVAEEHAAELRETALAARGAANARRDERDHAVEALRTAERAAIDATQKRTDVDAVLARAGKDIDSHLAELTPAFAHVPDWQHSLAVDARVFSDGWQTTVELWLGHTETKQRCDTGRRELQLKIDEARKQAEAYQQDYKAAAARLVEARTQLNGLTEQRQQLFDGKSAAQVAGAFEQAISAAEQVHQQHASGHQQAAELHASTTAKLSAQKENQAERTAALDGARGEFARALEQAGMLEPGLRKRLLVSDGWVSTHVQRRDELADAMTKQTTVVEERRAQRAQHEQEAPPDVGRADAQQAEQIRRAELESARETQVDQASRLRADDDARTAHAKLASRLAEQTQREALYKSLADLIGSADGGKFREFAQSLTLEALLGAANEHLSELHVRYRLLRVPDHHLALQVVDRSMGDEVRSVNSLSGGESFLVSLALALGLSSLAAKDTRVESLLIDEGFGTLDQDTLETALAVLDSLQASGRKVGLISHVPGLAERIGVRVTVSPQGGGRSTVRVES